MCRFPSVFILLLWSDFIQGDLLDTVETDDIYRYPPEDSAHIQLKFDPSWPTPDALKSIGPITAAVPTDPHGRNTLLLHRADRIWDTESFDEQNVYRHQSTKPIKTGVLARLQDGKLKSMHLTNRFYMPHGLTVDYQGNVWITDVALHQVFKFGPDLKEQPLLVLGERFRPGNDATQFCKPTHVVVASDGHFFVSDGYCNNRILKFNATGSMVAQWGRTTTVDFIQGPYDLHVPHQMALIEEQDLLCVADRENYRVACFVAGLRPESEAQTGQFVFELREKLERAGPVYGLAFYPHASALFALVAIDDQRELFEVQVYNIFSTEHIGTLTDEVQGFANAHTISTCPSMGRAGCLIVCSLSQQRKEEDDKASRRIWFYDIPSEDVEQYA